MPRSRQPHLTLAVLLLALGSAAPAHAQSAATSSAAVTAPVNNQDAAGGLKAALEQAGNLAVSKLGAENGYLNNPRVRIPLPKLLEQARPLLKMTGKGQQLDDLVLQMNRAAESAIPLARPLLVNAVKNMSFSDAWAIVRGGDNAATEYLREKTSGQLAQEFLPMVRKVTERAGLAAQYNSTMALAPKLGVQPKEYATVEGYVTQRALDGLYVMLADEEKAIRANPLASGSKLISKVFGALK